MTNNLADIREYLSYEAETGIFRWIKSPSRRVKVGDVAGNISESIGGYRRIRFRNKYYLAHRLAWFFVRGTLPEHEIDHKEGVSAGDGMKNLRPATSSQNKANASIRRDNTSGYKGVSLFRQTQRWSAELHANGRRVFSGYFATPEDAARAYDAAATAHFGEFAKLNFPRGC